MRETRGHHRSCGNDCCTHPPPPSVRVGEGEEVKRVEREEGVRVERRRLRESEEEEERG